MTKSKNLILVWIVTLAGMLVFFGIQRRQLNWDIIGYTGVSYFVQGLRGEALRDKTYSEIKVVTSPATFEELTKSSAYRDAVFSNPTSLEEHMPFYAIRMGYNYAIKTVSSLFNLLFAEATYVLSAIFAGMCVLLIFSLFYSENKWALVFFPIILYFAGFLELGSLSTPDSMAAFLALTTWLLYQKNKPWLALIPLTLLPLVRTDFIIVAGILGSFLCVSRRHAQAALYFLFPALMYIYVNKVNLNYGYLKIFNFTLIGIDPFPATMHIETTLMPYLKAYVEGFSAFIGHKHFILFTLYGLCWFKYIRPQKNSLLNQQVGLVLGFVLFHMLLFPAYYQRFFAWCAAIAGLQLVTWIYEIRGAHRIRKSSAIPFSEKTL